MENIKQHDHRTTRRPDCVTEIRMGEYRSCRVRLFQERHHQHRRRQDGEGYWKRKPLLHKKRRFDKL